MPGPVASAQRGRAVSAPPAAGASSAMRAPWAFLRRRVGAEPAAAIASGLLLAAAYPPLAWSALAWIALVPLLWAAGRVPPRRAAVLGFASGALFWHATLAWLQRVTTAGWIALALYCALYTALFSAAWSAGQAARRRRPDALGVRLATVLFGVAGWVGLEYIRSTLFTGFPWNPLGVSQFRRTVLIQVASFGGVFAVSALVAGVNVALALRLTPVGARRRRYGPELLLALAAVLGAVGWGRAALRRLPPPDRTVSIALVQPAIPQYVKWDEAFVRETYGRLEALTRAAQRGGPDLIVWPETAIADVLRASEEGVALVRRVAEPGVPLLIGALDGEQTDEGEERIFNSAFLIGPGGVIEDVYDKRHLVLFGEYVPFSGRLPFLRSLSPIEMDVTPGTEPGLFRLGGNATVFGAVICFEDTVPALLRDLARGGAQWFVVLTNNAWFDFSSGSMQHMAQSVFRTVEQRRPMVRAANSGVTCWVDADGRIGGARGEEEGILPFYGEGPVLRSGFLTVDLPIRDTPPPPTFHQRHGDLFGRVCAGLLLLLGAAALVHRRRGRPRGSEAAA